MTPTGKAVTIPGEKGKRKKLAIQKTDEMNPAQIIPMHEEGYKVF